MTTVASSSLHLGGISSLPAVNGPSTARRPPTDGGAGGGRAHNQQQSLTARRPSDNNHHSGGGVAAHGGTSHTHSNAGGLLPPILPAGSGAASGAADAAGSGQSTAGPSAAAELMSFQHALTPFEKQEVASFPELFYYGQNCTAKVQSPVAGGINNGYDDDRGDYSLILYDHVCYRYEIVGFLGKGSFGQVAKVFDHKRQTLMALKVLRNKKKFHQQAQVEIKVLQHLRHRDPDGKYGIVQILDTFTFRNHICLTYELLSLNLYEYLKSNKFTPMPLPVVKKIGASVLISLAFMWREGIIHCDLKPENILLRQPNRTGVKVIDLGSACFENERLYTYIQSRFYRAPEVILGIPYTRRIDLWSYACVLCELATGIPIFPGESETEQMALIMEYINVPPPELVAQGPHKAKFFEANGQPKLVPNSRKKIRTPNTKTLHGFLGLPADDLFVSFIKMFLTWDPEERPPPEHAMRHPWICDAYVGLTPSMPTVKRRYVPVAERGVGASGSGSGSGFGGGPSAVPTSPRVSTGADKPGSSRRQQRVGANIQPLPPPPSEDGGGGGSSAPAGYVGGAPRLPTVPQPKNKNPRRVPV